MGGDPIDPRGRVPGEVEPTPEEEAAQAVKQWLVENSEPNAGDVRILADDKTVVVYWKGDPPAELQEIVAS
jgi:hypothetical protein